MLNIDLKDKDLERIEEIRELALFAEMANYCLIKRMEEPNVGSTYCYVEEYLKERIKVFELEGINVDYEKELLQLTASICVFVRTKATRCSARFRTA